MNIRQFLTCALFGVVMAAGCGSSTSTSSSPDPYETCYARDICAGGLFCAATNLPASSGYTGYFCTSGCDYDSDCVQVPANYSAACVNRQCYLTCPAGNYTCPYDQDCFTFYSSDGYSVDLCTP